MTAPSPLSSFPAPMQPHPTSMDAEKNTFLFQGPLPAVSRFPFCRRNALSPPSQETPARPPVSRVLQSAHSARAAPHFPSINDDSPPKAPCVHPPDDPAGFPFWRSARTTAPPTPALRIPPPAKPGRMGPLPMRSHSSPTPVFEQIFSMTSTLGRFSFRS